MEAFNNFTIASPESIIGGRLVPTRCRCDGDDTPSDYYDTTRERMVYVQ